MADEQELVQRLDQSLAEHKMEWLCLTPELLIDRSREITAVQDAYEFLTSGYNPDEDEVALLLQCDDPLQYVAGWVEGHMGNGDDLYTAYDDALHELREELNHQAAQKEPEKTSVLEKLREKQESVKNSPVAHETRPVDKEAR